MAFRNEIVNSYPHILLIETVPHGSNFTSVRLNEKVRFAPQARLPHKIYDTDGHCCDQKVMNFINPNFCTKALLDYYKYLKALRDQSSNHKRFIASTNWKFIGYETYSGIQLGTSLQIISDSNCLEVLAVSVRDFVAVKRKFGCSHTHRWIANPLKNTLIKRSDHISKYLIGSNYDFQVILQNWICFVEVFA